MPAPTPSISIVTFVEEELSRARPVWDRFVDAVLEQAAQQQSAAKFPALRGQADEWPRLLQENRAFMAVAYLDAVKAQVRRAPRLVRPSRAGAQREPGLVLELVDLDSIALDVELARVIQAVKNEAEHELVELQAYLASLVGDADIETDHNPFHPAAHGRALRAAAQVMRAPLAQQLAFVRAAAEPFARSLRQAYAAACRRLEAAGVEPASHRCIVQPDGTRAVRTLSDEADSPDLRHMRDALPRSERRATWRESGREPGRQHGRDGAHDQDRHQDRLQDRHHEHHQDRQPDRHQARHQERHQERHRERHQDHHQTRHSLNEQPSERPREPVQADAALDPADRRAVDLVNRLFKAFPLDERVPEDVRAIIARLRAPALRLTLRDASVLDQGAHPLWKLIHLLAYQAEMLPRADDPERQRWLEFGRRTIEELSAAPAQASASYQAAFERVERFLRERLAQRCVALTARFQALQATEAGLAATQAGATTRPSSLNATLAAMLPRATLGRVNAEDARHDAEAWFNGLVPGEWVRALLKGNWVHAQLLWQGERRQIVLLGDASSDTTWALRRSVLVKMHMHGLAKTLKMRSLVGTAALRVREQMAPAAA